MGWLIGTRKGLFHLTGQGLAGPSFAGIPVGLVHVGPTGWVAALQHGHYGAKLHVSTDRGQNWEERTTPAFREGIEASVDTLWAFAETADTLWCGTIPGGLFRSGDQGRSWSLVRSLWETEQRPKWFGGGFDAPGIHSILVDPRDPRRLRLAVSCGGVWESRDDGETWTLGGDGLRADFLPPELAGDPTNQDPHMMVQCPTALDRLWIQHHCGIFRSDDGGARWVEVKGEPSSFGFAVAVHPHDPDTAWFVPAVQDDRRMTVDGKLVVSRTRDGGSASRSSTRGCRSPRGTWSIATRWMWTPPVSSCASARPPVACGPARTAVGTGSSSVLTCRRSTRCAGWTDAGRVAVARHGCERSGHGARGGGVLTAVLMLWLAVGPAWSAEHDPLETVLEEREAEGDLEGALTAALQLLEQARTSHGEAHEDVAHWHEAAGHFLGELGRHEQALAHYEASLRIREQRFGSEHAEVARTLCNLGTAQYQGGHPAAGLATLERCVALRGRVAGVEPSERAMALLNLSWVAWAADRPERTLAALEEAVGVYEAESAPDLAMFTTALNNLGFVLEQLGRPVQAEARYRQDLALREQHYGADDVRLTGPLYRLMVLARDGGAIREALSLSARLLELREGALPPGHPEVIDAIYARGSLLRQAGQLKRARTLLERALTAAEQRPEAESIELLLPILSAQASLLQDQGDSEAALVLSRRALTLIERHAPPGEGDIARAHHNLANALFRAERCEEALPHERTALELWQAMVVVPLDDVAAAYNGLGLCLSQLGDAEGAEAAYRESLRIETGLFGAGHPNLAVANTNLATLLLRHGNADGAVRLLTEVIEAWQVQLGPDHARVATVRGNLAYALESAGDTESASLQRSKALATREQHLELLAALSDRESAPFLRLGRATLDAWLVQHDDPSFHREAWGHQLTFKGVGNRVQAARARASEDQAHARLAEVRRALAEAVMGTSGQGTSLEALTEEKERIERFLGGEEVIGAVAPETICAALAPGEVLVDFLHFMGAEGPQYLAFVVDRSCGPVRVALGAGEVLDEAVVAWREALERGLVSADARGERVHGLIWQPLAAHLAEAQRVWLVPDGRLALAPWSALPLGEDRYLVEALEPRVLTSATDLTRPATGSATSGLVTVSDVAYPTDAVPDACVGYALAPLAYSGEESRRVQRLWRRRRRGPVTVLEGAEATEQAVTQALEGARLVHLPTHGFYASGCEDADNPMTRSGLVLGRGDGGDALLTAEEVASLRMEGTELVLLSACQSALGARREGEGLMGLQRGFAIAGAEAVVASLWSVPDEPTARLMAELVRHFLGGRGRHAAASLRHAQLRMLAEQRQRYGEALPRQWGAWIASGPGRR